MNLEKSQILLEKSQISERASGMLGQDLDNEAVLVEMSPGRAQFGQSYEIIEQNLKIPKIKKSVVFSCNDHLHSPETHGSS